MKTKNTRMAMPTSARTFRLRKYSVRRNWATRGLGRRFSETSGAEVGGFEVPAIVLPQPHARIEVRVEDVDDDVRRHDDDREQEGRAEDEAEIVRLLHGVREQEPDAAQVEDEFDDREPSDEPGERE